MDVLGCKKLGTCASSSGVEWVSNTHISENEYSNVMFLTFAFCFKLIFS